MTMQHWMLLMGGTGLAFIITAFALSIATNGADDQQAGGLVIFGAFGLFTAAWIWGDRTE